MDWSVFPKVELHLHLGCSLSYAVVSQIDPSITYEEFRQNFVAPPKCVDLADYLTRAPASRPLMQTEERLRLVVLDLFDQLCTDNVIYAEIRFAPGLRTEGELSARQVVACVEAATAEAVCSTGVEARLILCTLRTYTGAQSLETVHLVEEFRGTYVAGFDIAADRPGNVIDDHIPAFQYAREKGIPCTAHPGETRGPSIIWDTYADHPIDRLYRAGVSVGVNTDARTISDITLSQEYARLHETFGWEAVDFFRCNRNALKAAFVPGEVREKLLKRLADGYQPYL